jgi:hypothetical protein
MIIPRNYSQIKTAVTHAASWWDEDESINTARAIYPIEKQVRCFLGIHESCLCCVVRESGPTYSLTPFVELLNCSAGLSFSFSRKWREYKKQDFKMYMHHFRKAEQVSLLFWKLKNIK